MKDNEIRKLFKIVEEKKKIKSLKSKRGGWSHKDFLERARTVWYLIHEGVWPYPEPARSFFWSCITGSGGKCPLCGARLHTWDDGFPLERLYYWCENENCEYEYADYSPEVIC